ncbi:MAG: peptidase S10 [Rhizomicrobium sp.]|jgi:carboxypeptidase C (cathepsin A)
MNSRVAVASFAALLSLSLGALADANKEYQAAANGHFFRPDSSASEGSVTVEGQSIDYHAVAGTLVVHTKGYDDSLQKPDGGDKDTQDAAGKDKSDAGDSNPNAEASMFYVAYFKNDVPARSRPITFVFNGGPGSASMWLHMGAFGPRRVVTADNSHTPAAPYALVDNSDSLMDASDLVFIDAPGTGFSRVAGKDKEKAFYGVDGDVHAFAEFITQFLSVYDRWNSPKYLFGESYGTPRSAALVNQLETEYSVDFNGVILLSQILNYDLSTGRSEFNPGIDLPYQLALPTYAATAWYHHKLPDYPGPIEPLLAEVEHFALTDYALALGAGGNLSAADRDAIAERLHRYTGLPVDYIKKANLRINGGEFEKTLQDDADMTTGRLDTRFSGPTLDPLSKSAEYDPQSAAIGSAYVSAFNAYVRESLHYGEGKTYKPSIPLYRTWDFHHQPPGVPYPVPQSMNVMPDLANAMKYNPNLKVQLNAGYYDLATPFFEGVYEMQHLPIPPELQSNIEFKFYQSGHMVYAHEESLKVLHDNAADFIRRTDNVTGE